MVQWVRHILSGISITTPTFEHHLYIMATHILQPSFVADQSSEMSRLRRRCKTKAKEYTAHFLASNM